MNIGNHISKTNNINKSISEYSVSNPNCPVQMFLSNPRTGKRSGKTIKQVENFKNDNVIYFTHAPYVINLCSNIDWMQRILNEELELTVKMNGKGVVVHVGGQKRIIRRHST